MSPVAAPVSSDQFISISDSEKEEDAFEIVKSWVQEREGEASNEELALIVDDELETRRRRNGKGSGRRWRE
jgi:hypothetical protein